MGSNFDRYKEVVDEVIAKGNEISQKIKEGRRLYSKIRADYAKWYAGALKLVKQFLRTSETDFKRHGDSIQDNFTDATHIKNCVSEPYYIINDYIKKDDFIYEQDIYKDNSMILVSQQKVREILPRIDMQLSFIEGVKDQLENSILETELLIQADVFDTELEQAQYLNEEGFTEAAGVIADKVLKRHLFYVCERRGFITKKEVSDIKNSSHLLQLLRENKRIDDITFQEIKPLVSIGNNCCHSSKRGVTRKRVQKLIDGTQEVIKTVF